MLLYYTPWKYHKTLKFSDVLRGIKKQHWAVMGYQAKSVKRDKIFLSTVP